MSFVPSSPDWCWFGQRTPQEIASFASRKTEQGIRWFQNAYRWLWNRLDPPQRESLSTPTSDDPVGPPLHWTPVLGVNTEKGSLGFLSVDAVPKYGRSHETGHGDEHRKNAYAAAKIVFDLFRTLDHDLGDPEIELHLLEGDGTSLSLPAMFAALGRILGVTWPDDIVSTGCFKDDVLKPVASDTLTKKIEAARQFGYKRLVLVHGQEIPENVDIETIFVGPDPFLALFEMLQLAENDAASDQRLARLLAVFGKKMERSDSADQAELVLQPFVQSPSRLVRHVACDFCSRIALHHGETAKANEYRKHAGELLWYEFPAGWLGHSLRYDQAASHAILAIDSGLWGDDEPVHRALDRRLKHLCAAKQAKIADSNDVLAILALSNTRSRRRRYLARLQQNTDLLAAAWIDLTLLLFDWDRLFDCCREFDPASDFPRQRNQCMETLADYRNIMGVPPDWPGVEEFLDRSGSDFELATIGKVFDLVCWLDRQVLLGLSSEDLNVRLDEIVVQRYLEKADEFFATNKNYPTFLPYEKLLAYRLGTKPQRKHAVDQLRQAKHLESELHPSSVLTLLALRTRVVLEEYGETFAFPPILPPEGSRLREIADDLRNDPSTLVHRCPY